MTTKRKYSDTSESIFTGKRLRNILAILFVLALLVSGAFATTGTDATTPLPEGRDLNIPPVPVGGVALNPILTHFHPTGLLSIPQLENWNLPGGTDDGGQEKLIVTDGPNGDGRVGIMLINSGAGSVIHAFAEHDPAKMFASIQELEASYSSEVLQGAWVSYTTWREVSRRIEGDTSIIDFELTITGDRSGLQNTDNFRARQLSRLENGWLVVMRLVAPNINAVLLDQLQNVVWANQRLYTGALAAPLSWNAIIDDTERYVVRYPSQWTYIEGVPGSPYSVQGDLVRPGTNLADNVTITTNTAPDAAVGNEVEARAWITANIPNATILRALPDTADMWTVSYSVPDADGNARSSITSLRRAEGKLYIVTIRLSARGLDLLDPAVTVAYPELDWIRDSLMIIPAEAIVRGLPTVPQPPQ